jgi:hypothetical protein
VPAHSQGRDILIAARRYKQTNVALEPNTMKETPEIARIDAEIERVGRAHDLAGELGEDQGPYKDRLSDLRMKRGFAEVAEQRRQP